MVIAELGGAGDPFAGAGIPVLAVRPLDVAASEAVLDRVVPALAGEARDRLLAGAAGNPLALTELATAAPPAADVHDTGCRAAGGGQAAAIRRQRRRDCSLGELRAAAAALHDGPMAERPSGS